MHNHKDDSYECPICIATQGGECEGKWIKQSDVFYKDDLVMGFIGSKVIKGNEHHPLIVPLGHIENLYDLPAEVGYRIMDVARRVALALKDVRQADGVTVLQNNEPAGDQHAFHYHHHIIPRFDGDHFHEERMTKVVSDPNDRIAPATALKEWFQKHPR
jgi:histidine triad (HIT) family protein